jgi:hypothetical protein
MKTTAKKKRQINIISILISVFSTLFIVGGALLIYFFSRGYRINVLDREIRRTGVLTVQSEPNLAQLYINGNSVGRTPRSRTLDIGLHSISIWKDGYREWKKQVEILEEKSTFVYPFLILEKIVPSTIWQKDAIVEKYWINKERDYFVFLVSEATEDELQPIRNSLWTYRINSPIWNLNPNPTEILSLPTNNIDLELSNNGQKAVIYITDEDTEKRYFLDLTKTNTVDKLEPIDIPELLAHNIVWSKDNRHIILESEEEIVSIDTSSPLLNQIPSLLTKKEGKTHLWNTDEEGFFYLLEGLDTPEDTHHIYALKQSLPDGSNPKYTIGKAYFSKDNEYIEYYRNNGDTFPEFKNSPISTQSIGQITHFEVNQNLNGVYIATDTSVYWYDISTNRYRMICPHPAQLISFSPDARKVLFVNNDYFYIFTLETEDGNQMEKIGTEKIKGIMNNEVDDIAWLSNSLYLYYKKDNILYLSEKDGENQMDLLELESILMYTTDRNREHIITIEISENKNIEINQYKIR